MTSFERGDVVLVHFVFSEGTDAKRRPALILSTEDYHRGRQEAIVAAITSHVSRQWVGDHVLRDWQGAGLLYPSRVTAILRTVKQGMIERRLGALKTRDLRSVEDNLELALGL